MKKIIVAITGASGAIYAQQLLRQLVQAETLEEIVVVTSQHGQEVWEYELGATLEFEIKKYLNKIETKNKVKKDNENEIEIENENEKIQLTKAELRLIDNASMFDAIASGSANYDAMVVIPCSMTTLGRIANGLGDNLIARAADVMLKERRPLVLVTRETPLNLVHINNMRAATLAGATICPASPAFYSHPQTIEQATLTVVQRVLAMLHIPGDYYQWKGTTT